MKKKWAHSFLLGRSVFVGGFVMLGKKKKKQTKQKKQLYLPLISPQVVKLFFSSTIGNRLMLESIFLVHVLIHLWVEENFIPKGNEQ